jgi:two-component system cell cycle sensor histidine kinase/response regulator CckA
MAPLPPQAVLVAEDQPQLRRLMERVLVDAGYEVLAARDGDEALASIAAHGARIAVAVLDATIAPGGAGEILEALAKQGRGIGVVLTSGDVLESDLLHRLQDCDGIFLHKPFAPSALLRALEDSLAKGEEA